MMNTAAPTTTTTHSLALAHKVRRRGAAMIETVLAMPIVLVVLVLLLGLGRSMMRWQQVAVMERYEASRQVAGAPGPAAQGGNYAQLNQTFLRGEAIDIEMRSDNYFPEEPTRILEDAAFWRSLEAGWFAERVVTRLPDGRRVRVRATFEPAMPMDERIGFAGPLGHGYVRLNHEWKFVNGLRQTDDGEWRPHGQRASLGPALRDRFLEDFDGGLEWLEAGENGVASSIRAMYLREPAYRGPDFEVGSQ